MSKSRVIGGAICMALAVLLGVLTYRLPPEKMFFMVGDQNMPIVPVIGLGVVGFVLLTTAGWGQQRDNQKILDVPQREVVLDEEKVALNQRLEMIGWGLFLIMLGGFILVPHEIIMKGVWSIGVGVIMLGLNFTRYFYKIRMSGFTTFLGIVSLISGVIQLLGMQILEGAILIIILGAYLILKPWIDRLQLFGRAEES